METTELVRAAEAARRVGVPASTFRAWVRKGLIVPVTLPDGQRRFRPVDLAWLREQVRLNDEAR
jgi:DNA-binding transcriptional MerR regulator